MASVRQNKVTHKDLINYPYKVDQVIYNYLYINTFDISSKMSDGHLMELGRWLQTQRLGGEEGGY